MFEILGKKLYFSDTLIIVGVKYYFLSCTLTRLFFLSYGNFSYIVIKSFRDFCKSKLLLLNFEILDVPKVFGGIGSISTIKNMIQT